MTDVKALLEKHKIRTNKSLGQNFLHKTDIIENIACFASGGRYALEIGAGPGVLSHELCGRFEKVATVEIDKSLAPVTSEALSGCKNHTMIYADFLKTDIGDIISRHLGNPPVTAVGNLPYNITGQIITKLIKNHSLFDRAVIMVQKEAAQKLCASPSDDGYRAVSVLTQYFCDIKPLFDVSPDSFIPAPHVTSTVLLMEFKNDLTLPEDKESGFFEFIHRIFSQRRKLLTSVFQKTCEKERLKEILAHMGFSEKTRGEQLAPSELAAVYKSLYVNKNEILPN